MEGEFAGHAVDAPASEAAGDFLHVLLGIAAIDAEGVELHDFAGIVFVDAAHLLGGDRLTGSGSIGRGLSGDFLVHHGPHLLLHGRDLACRGVAGVVEIMEHGRAFGGGLEQIVEGAPEVGTDDFAVIDDFEDAVGALLDVDVEVVAPEIDEDFLQLALRIDRADELGLLELADGGDGAPLIGEVGHGGEASAGRWCFDLILRSTCGGSLHRRLHQRGLAGSLILGCGRLRLLLLLLEGIFAVLQKE